MKVGAIRQTTAHFSSYTSPVYNLSLFTFEISETTRESALDVGIPRLYIASEQRYSRIDERRTALPSACLEYGVNPLPLSCKSTNDPFSPKNGQSCLDLTSPSEMARPSPN